MDNKRISLIVPVEVYQVLVQLANENDRSLNNYINLLFRDIVNEYNNNSDKR